MLLFEHPGNEISIGSLIRVSLVFQRGKRALIHMIAIHHLLAEMGPIRIVVGKGRSRNRDLPVSGRRCRGLRNSAGALGCCFIRRRGRNKVDRNLGAKRDRRPPAFCDFLDLGGGDGVPGISHPILDLAVLFGGSVDLDISAVLEVDSIGDQDIGGQQNK